MRQVLPYPLVTRALRHGPRTANQIDGVSSRTVLEVRTLLHTSAIAPGPTSPIGHTKRTPRPWEPPINYLPLMSVLPMRLARSDAVGAVIGAGVMRRPRASRTGVISAMASPVAARGEPSKTVRARRWVFQ